MAVLDRLRVYPVKALDGIDVERATITPGGTLAHDREFAMFDAEGDVVNGSRTALVHDLATDFDPETTTLSVRDPEGETVRFALDDPAERERAQAWLGGFFDLDIVLERDRRLGYVDRRSMGPSVIATATLETVASWFDELTVDGVRRRMRANVEIGDVPAFWADRFVGEDAPTFEIGGVEFEGVTPCVRCVVPERDPDTGERTPDFRRRFVEKRRETFPEWADANAFEHDYSLMTIARIPESDRGRTLTVGDEVTIAE
ncbi:MOSC domain-containing protein [Halovivax gelatinilyticus]|uniref:MOSC domain-containing protein n=1 Tax=Halovivax gelatinilyticus TaxID=2961597 RepID=UPI0020CA5D96|nr:MOSC N-terminal beta barrel domain-containing protein [Halovivax gelatinilyticus]